MPNENQGNPKRIDTLVINDDAEAPSLLNPVTGQMLITNRVGKRIIELADGSRDVAAIARQISTEFRRAHEPEVAAHAEAFLAEGTKKGIVTWTEQG